ncbi:MAG: tRNA pseudouridine(38-40) synthase TruA, partial [Clostridia bacterium]|nr:tRNA pseudouridine(38-40) synthase TruA [Clostridia bacterium]
MKLLLKISFLGTYYNGYQVQPSVPTIQQKLNEAAKRIFGYDCDIVGCSRTDSGVHANEFFVTVSKKGEDSIDCTVPCASVPLALNSVLPDDIAVLSAKEVEDTFHPRYDVKYKEYIYKIWDDPIKDPFISDRAYHIPQRIDDEAIAKMNEAAGYFCGQHDFASYMAQGSKIVDTRRTVYSADVETDGDMIIFRVSADGFLYNMVRIMVGTLAEVGEGR